jgi:hypothetical protein
LHGAVISTTAATGTALAVLYLINARAGMQLQPGMVLLSLAPAALSCGPTIASFALMVVAFAVPFSKTLLTADERRALNDLGCAALNKFTTGWARPAEHAEPSHAI